MILCANPLEQYRSRKEEIDAAIRSVLEGGQYILGRKVEEFEESFARYLDVSDCIGVGSGTEALHLALRACGVGPGDEVITVSHTAVATVAAIALTGAQPVFVDIEDEYLTLDPDRLESALSERTKAIVPVHLYGHPVDLGPVLQVAERHGLTVVEDCAQAHGARCGGRKVGGCGHVGCFSFYPTKNLGALGDGGAVVTGDGDLAGRVRSLREYGWSKGRLSDTEGWNSRLDEIQAAVLEVKLRYLEDDNLARARIAQRYRKGLQDLDLRLPEVRRDSTHVYHLYVVRCERRNDLEAFMKGHGIGVLVHYPVPVHLQPAYRRCRVAGGGLPGTERAASEVLSLPIYPGLDDDSLESVIETIRSFG